MTFRVGLLPRFDLRAHFGRINPQSQKNEHRRQSDGDEIG
jgi:hypothetical protein